MIKTLTTFCAVVFLAAGSTFGQISDAGSVLDVTLRLPTGDYFVVPGLGNGAGFFISGGPYTDSTFNDAAENIGMDLNMTDVLSADLLTNNENGTCNTLFTLTGDLAPAGFTDGAGAALDTAAIFFGANAGGTPINWGGSTVVAANIDAFAAGASIFGSPVDLIPLGFDVQSGSFGVSFGAGTAGIGIDTITLDVLYNDPACVPEPASGLIALLGLAGLGLSRRS